MTNGRDPAEITRLAIQRRMTRRTLPGRHRRRPGAMALAACAPPSSGSAAPSTGGGAPSTAPSTAASAPPASAALGDTLTLATWPNYHSQEVLDAFTADTGVAINVAVYGSTEEMEAKIRAGNSGIDVVLPSNYAIEGWVADKPDRADRLRQAARLREGRLESAVHGPGVRQGQHALHPEELGHDRHRLPQLEGHRGRHDLEAVLRGRRDDLRRQDPDRRPPDQLVRLGGGGDGLSLNTIDPTEMAAVEAMLIGAQAQAVRDLVGRAAAAARARHVAVDRVDRRRRAGRSRQRGRPLPRGHRRRRALDR